MGDRYEEMAWKIIETYGPLDVGTDDETANRRSITILGAAMRRAEAELVARIMDPPTEPFEQFEAYQAAINAGAVVLNKYVGKHPSESFGGTYDWATECIEAFLKTFAAGNNIPLEAKADV